MQLGLVELEERRDRALVRRIVDEDVELAEPHAGEVHQHFGGRGVGDVGRECDRGPAGLRDLGDQVVEELGAPGDADDGRALLRELDGDGAPESLAGAGDCGDQAVQVVLQGDLPVTRRRWRPMLWG